MFDDLSNGQFNLRPAVDGRVPARSLIEAADPTNAPDWGQVAGRVIHDIRHTHGELDAKVATDGVEQPIPLRARPGGKPQVLDGHHRLISAAARGQDVPFCWSV